MGNEGSYWYLNRSYYSTVVFRGCMKYIAKCCWPLVSWYSFRILLLVGLGIIGLAGQAQIPYADQVFHIEPVRSENRISENAARDIIKDRQGYLWIATIDGLNRFDGYEYKIYHANPTDSNSLSHNYITDLYEDSNGVLWIGTFAGLDRYSRDCDCFISSRYLGGPSLHVTDIAEDDQGRIWVSSTEGIDIWDEDAKAFVQSLRYGNPLYDMLERRVTGLHIDSMGGIWIGWEREGISYLKNGKMTHFLQGQTEEGSVTGSVSGFLPRQDGTMFLSAERGIFHFDPERDSCEHKLAGRSWNLYEFEGAIHANMSFDGIYRFNESRGYFEKVQVYYEGKPVDGDIKLFLKDDNDITWVMFRGLAKIDPYEHRFKHIIHDAGDPSTVSAMEINGMGGDDEGNLVVTTQYGGLNFYDSEQDVWHNYRNNKLYQNKLQDIILGTVVVLDGNFVWLEGKGLHRFDRRTGIIKTWGAQYGINDPRAFIREDDGRHWLLGRRVYRFDPDNQIFEMHQCQEEFLDLYKDDTGVLWAVSHSRVYQFHETINEFIPFVDYSHHLTTSIPGMFMMVDSNNVWLGSSGLTRIDISSKTQVTYNTDDGLPNDNIVSMVSDGHYVWLATNNGLSRFDYEHETFLNFDKLDGLQDEIFLPNSVHKDAVGNLYFGGINGINTFHPDSLALGNPHPPKVLITQLKLLNKSVKPGANSVLERDIAETSELRLPHQYSTISFELKALGYSQSEKNQYAYRILGVDHDWNYTQANHTAVYSRLPRGKNLAFQAKASNHDGIWSAPRTIEIYIVPPFWETTWFRTAVIGLILACFWLGYRIRVRNIKMKNKLLKEEVRRQTRKIKKQSAVLVEANKELKENALSIESKANQLKQMHQAQSQFFIGLSHELKTPLTILLGYLDELRQSDDSNREINDRMRVNAKQMVHLVNQLMDKAKLDSGQYKLKVTEGDLIGDAESIVTSFSILAAQRDLELNFVDETFQRMAWYDADILFKTISNLISNALKFTPSGGRITVIVSPHAEGEVQFCIEDNGIGIPEESVEKVFERFYQVEDHSRGRDGTGIGLSLARKLVQLHKGTMWVDSVLGEGSRFYVRFPVDKASYLPTELGQVTTPSADNISQYFESKLFEPDKFTKDTIRDVPERYLLLVEDNPETRALIVRQLSSEYRILEASHGKEGLALARKYVPDIILSDVIMPEMDGITFCQTIKEQFITSHIPIVMLTAMSTSEHKIRGLQQGANAYLSKPFLPEELRLVLHNQLAHGEAMRKQFMREFDSTHIPGDMAKLDREFLSRINTYLEDNLSRSDLHVADFCKELGVSRTQLFRKLKSLVDMSLTEYIRDYRLKRSYEYLQESDQTVSEIIHQTGFNSRSYFYQSFKKKFGFTPKELMEAGKQSSDQAS